MIKLEIYCAECGEALGYSLDKVTDDYLQLEVHNCKTCLGVVERHVRIGGKKQGATNKEDDND